MRIGIPLVVIGALQDKSDTWNVQNNYFENNSSGNGENFWFFWHHRSEDDVFENIDCEHGT